MSDESHPTKRTGGDMAVLGICEVLALLFALPFGEALYRNAPITIGQWFYLIVGLASALLGRHGLI